MILVFVSNSFLYIFLTFLLAFFELLPVSSTSDSLTPVVSLFLFWIVTVLVYFLFNIRFLGFGDKGIDGFLVCLITCLAEVVPLLDNWSRFVRRHWTKKNIFNTLETGINTCVYLELTREDDQLTIASLSHTSKLRGMLVASSNETDSLLLLYNNSEDARFFRGFTGTITHSWLTNQSARIDLKTRLRPAVHITNSY